MKQLTPQEQQTNLQANLVVIGAGGAGLAAAVTYGEKGGTGVIVLEKTAPGGNTAMSHDIFGAASPVQKRAQADARPDDLFKMSMDWCHWSKVNPRLVRAYIDKSGDTIGWLEEKGIKFELLPMFPNQVPLVRHAVNGHGAELMRVLRKNCEDKRVKVLTHTAGKKILRDANGNISGVVAQTKEGEITIKTSCVLVATGGYAANREMLKKYCSYYQESMTNDGVKHNMGDGIVMATEIGSDTAGLGHMTLHGPQVTSQNKSDFINLDRMGTDGNPLKIRIGMFAREPTTIWANKDGRRFVDEGSILQFFAYGNVISQQPEGICYSIFDNATTKIMEEQGLYMQAAPRWATPYEALTPLPGLEREFYKHPSEVLKKSNSWDEIADWIGADRKVLKAAIDEYNAACDRGYDPIFCKDRRYLLPLRTAPYYAIRGHAGICDTMGGIKVNEKMEVLDTKNKPIPGLFGAGATVGCWESESYCYRLTGHLVGFALNSGRIAAETAFAYLSK